MWWHARYELMWGHTAPSRTGPVQVTRLDYNAQAGAETPEQPEVPICAQHVWDWWWELNARRPPGFDSLSPFSYSEVAYWILLTGRKTSPEEIRWLMVMDDKWLHTINEERKAKQDREKEARETKQPVKPKRRK